MSRFDYTDAHTAEISFPIGGIGTGCIGLAGNGRLIDWEIFNKPNKGSVNGFSHFAVKAERAGQLLDARVLNGELTGSYTGLFGRPWFFEGYGWGPLRESMGGMPHFEQHSFKGEYPFAEITFSDHNFPGNISLIAFNPFIPTNEDDSGLPAAFFEISLTNTTETPLDYTVVGVLGNVFRSQGFNEVSHDGQYHMLHIGTSDIATDAFEYGDLTLATDAPDCSYQEYWYRGTWTDALEIYWRDLMKPGKFQNRHYPREKRFVSSGWHERDNANLAAHLTLAPGETRCVRFVITWNFPNNRNYWQHDVDERAKAAGIPNGWKNYYATQWENSRVSAHYALQEWDRLHGATKLFKDSLFGSTLPPVAIDAISATMSVLKSPTILRLQDGTLYGWEGVGETEGCCYGSCTHVWNYAQTQAFLFPRLERSMRTANYRYNVDPDGGSHFRIQLPIGLKYSNFRPCADGQFGDVMKTYRDWKISGDTEWLRSLWPTIKKTIEFAWSDKNRDLWDPEKTGVLWGRQHHTLDMELFGPNAWLTGFYLGALKAAAEMAVALDEPEFAQELRSIFARGKTWADDHLFNGEYYGQVVDIKDYSLLEKFDREDDRTTEMYWSAEHGEIKYQIGEGVEIDMLIGQWHANLYGLGEIFDPEQTKTALAATFRYNFNSTMRNEYNPWRLFSLNNEGGLVICAWPEGRIKPMIPVPYSQETMTGFEWAAAIHMLQVGLIDEGMQCVEAIRNRYNGEKRNPWNEIECGSNYARAMASFGLLNAFSGFQFDMVSGVIGFAPIRMQAGEFRVFWSLDSAWGEFSTRESYSVLKVLYGELRLTELQLPLTDGQQIQSAALNDETITHSTIDNVVHFAKALSVQAGSALTIRH